MARRGRKRNNTSSRRGRVAPASQPLLKSVSEMLLNSQTSSVPNTRDIVVPRIAPNKFYTFVQTVNATITSSTTVEVDNAYSFSLSQLPNASSFTTIFDSYRITGINVKFNPSGGPVGPQIYTVIDYDDANGVTISTMQSYDTLKIAPAGVFFERSLVPRIALAAYSGAFTSYAQEKMVWLDCASPSVAHFGLKINVPVYSGSYTWGVAVVYTIQFKNSR